MGGLVKLVDKALRCGIKVPAGGTGQIYLSVTNESMEKIMSSHDHDGPDGWREGVEGVTMSKVVIPAMRPGQLQWHGGPGRSQEVDWTR
jgi:hypothetical protein